MEKIHHAIKEKELLLFLMGKGEYAFSNHYSNTPTDPHKVLDSIKIVIEGGNYPYIKDEFISSLIKLSQNQDLCWLSLYYLVGCMRWNARNQILIPNINELASTLIKNVSNNESFLNRNNNWIGAEYKDGIWGDVTRMIFNINEEFNTHFSFE
jgi:hypothetical protein